MVQVFSLENGETLAGERSNDQALSMVTADPWSSSATSYAGACDLSGELHAAMSPSGPKTGSR